MKTCEISVVIPCYNAEGTLAEQLEALAQQQSPDNWEVIVADNGSTDRSLDIVESYFDRIPALQIVDASDCRGAAHSRNVGVDHARGQVVLFIDADDVVAPGWLSAMWDALRKHDFVAGRLDSNKLNPQWVARSRVPAQVDRLPVYPFPPHLPYAASANMGIRRSLHKAVNGFDETWETLEDTDFCFKVQLQGTKLHFVPQAAVYYRYRDSFAGIFNQSVTYAACNVLLRKTYRPAGDTRRHSVISAAVAWARLVWHLKKTRTMEERARWMWELGDRLGRIRGSLQHRVIDL